MSHTVAKPKTAANSLVSVFVSSGDFNLSTSHIFRMKPSDVTLDFSVQVADITGDADVNATYTHNEMTRGRFTLRGYALGESAVYFSSLQSVYNGMSPNTPLSPGPGTNLNTNIMFNWASAHYIHGTAIIEEIQMTYARANPYVGVAMAGRFTETPLGTAAYVDAESATPP